MTSNTLCTYKVQVRWIEQREDAEVVTQEISHFTNSRLEAQKCYSAAGSALAKQAPESVLGK